MNYKYESNCVRLMYVLFSKGCDRCLNGYLCLSFPGICVRMTANTNTYGAQRVGMHICTKKYKVNDAVKIENMFSKTHNKKNFQKIKHF